MVEERMRVEDDGNNGGSAAWQAAEATEGRRLWRRAKAIFENGLARA